MRIVACGDTLFSSRNLLERLPEELVRLFQEADGVFANAEFCCPRQTTAPMPRRFITAVRPDVLDEFAALNIKLLSFANNHTGDFGMQGVIDTLEEATVRKLIPGGIGRSLDEARAAHFIDTPKGRIGFVAAGSTRATEFAASDPGKGVPARAGLNPLRWGRSYVLPEKEFNELKRIDELLGTAASRREVAAVEVMKPAPDDRFAFGSVFEGSLQIIRGAEADVCYHMDERDREAILANVRDAANRSEIALVSLHAHEGTTDNWYSPRAASFVEDFAHQAIDAGATAVLGHGPHMLRGVEIYKGKPIFYSLGSLLMEFVTGNNINTPEMYAAYGFGRDSLPSDLHMSRVADENGNKIGFYADQRFSRSCVAVLDIEDGRVEISLVPIDLDLNRERPSQRGFPQIASAQLGQEIANDIAALSEYYGTRIEFDADSNLIRIQTAV